MARLIVLLLVIAVMSSGITFFIYLFSKKQRVAKYLPSLVAVGMAAYYLLLSRASYEGLQDIGRMIIAMMFAAWAAAGIITAVIIDAMVRKMDK